MADLNTTITEFLNISTTYDTLTINRVVIALVMSCLINFVIFYPKTSAYIVKGIST